MKLTVVIVAVLLIQQCTECHITKIKRSLHMFDYISNKTTQVTRYIKTKGEVMKNITMEKVNNAIFSVSSLYTRGKKSLTHITENHGNAVKNNLQYYIDKAHGTANTIFDIIAPEQKDYECSNKDPANEMTATELITIHGYYVESHTVITKDGYLLTLHRIPYPRNSRTISNKTVLLHHGFLGSSIDWVIPGPRRSLPYILSDHGYDVWMANSRGNTYSRAHVFKNIDSNAFWNFTFQDIAQFDLPAVIDYIQEHKTGNEKINYIGFSMGTTVLFAMLSTNTQYNEILKGGYTLAPVAYMTDIKSPFKLLAKYGKTIETFFKLVGANEFLPRNAVLRYLSKHSCKIDDFQEAFCEISMFLFCAHDNKHFDRSLTPIIFGHVPAGASTKTLAHFAQEIRNNGKFQKFDYGEEGNMKEYGTPTPPQYPLSRITLPMTMISAQDDWLSSITDAKNLYQQLVNPVEHYIVPDKTFNHLDFLFAKDAHTLVYHKLLLMLEKSYAQPSFETNQIS